MALGCSESVGRPVTEMTEVPCNIFYRDSNSVPMKGEACSKADRQKQVPLALHKTVSDLSIMGLE